MSFLKNDKIQRLVALVMIPILLFTSLFVISAPSLSAHEDTPYITLGGERVSDVTIKEDEKIRLNVETTDDSNAVYTWQIQDQMQEERWINISGEYSKWLWVTYAKIGSMLNSGGSAFLRCKVTTDKVTHHTEPVEIRVSYNIVDEPEVQNNVKLKSRARTALAAEGQDEFTTYTIVINYLFDNNAIAFEPFGASVAKGSAFKQKVESPKILGYAPFRRVGEDYVDASTVEIDIPDVQGNVTINVIYEPAMVEFSVHHHLQNLLDDEYSLHYDYITKGHGLTGTLVGEGLAYTEEQLPGFKSLAYDHLTIAADGSTTIEIRYDRNYYLVDFDMSGGYGTEPVYTRYGMTVGANNPIRHGYVFDGWELISYGGETPTAEQRSQYDISNGKTISVPAANLRYRAKWITQETEYTMVFWRENANDNGYSYWGYLGGLKAMSGSTVDGEDWIERVSGIDDEAYFTFNSEKTDKDVLVEGDGSTVVNVYYTRNYYKLTIEATGKCTIPEQHVHTDACYDLVCGKEHVHTDACIPSLECTIPVHTVHTDACLTCTIKEHIHGSGDCTCTLAEHQHTVNCWSGIIAQTTRPSGAQSSPEDGYVYRSYAWGSGWQTRIYIKGTWYTCSIPGVSSGDIVDPSCGYDYEHTHGTNCSCNEKEHKHSENCYIDVLHEHSENCYRYSCNEEEHVHNEDCKRLKCGITEGHTHSTTCNNSGRTNVVKTVYRKYLESVEDLWPMKDDNGKVYNSGQRWEPEGSTYYDAVLVYISTMPGDDFTLTLNTSSNDTYTMEYYEEVLPGQTYDVQYDNRQYKLERTIKANYNYITKAEDFFDVTGFTQYKSSPSFGSNGQIDINGGGTVKFYYNRIVDHVIEFNNNGEVLDDKTVNGVMYEAPVKEYNFTPEYPTNLEPNAYTFAGWYTSPGCFDGTEVDWNTLTMPEGDLLLYAKWIPITHRVRVFKDRSLAEQIGTDQIVDHKAFAYEPNGIVENGSYIFQGWFYMDEGEEKAFVFNGIPVLHDIDVYAKWGSHISVNYKINYVLFNTKEPIADPTEGTTIAGNNKTFEAKAGTQLYPGFQSGFYPLQQSHTITMSVDGTREFTFEYVYVESMPYKVQYINKQTGEKVFEDKYVMDNSLSVITETFKRKEGMMPDAYQKRLVLAATETDEDNDNVYDSNVLTFYYSKDSEHAYYRVAHYIQNISGESYREFRSEEFVGEIGTEYSVEALSLNGFVFAGQKTKINGVVTPVTGTTVKSVLGSEGMLIELYYNRTNVDYMVRYVDSITGEDIVAPKTGSGVFGAQVIEYAPDLAEFGYDRVSEDAKTLTLSANEEHNVIEFVYQESIASIKYEIVGPDGCGILSQYSENLLALSGEPIGSRPTVFSGYEFIGWFTDKACTTPVENSLVNVETKELVPEKDGIWKNKTYYAKFVALETELTIQTSSALESDSDQSFVFKITGKEGTETEGVDVTVTVVGNNKVTITELPIGTYTVTEVTNWSWRYENDSAVREVVLEYNPEGTTILYDNNRQHEKWLDGNDVATNVFGNN